MTLFGDEALLPHREERELAGAELRARVREAVEELAVLVDEDVQELLARVRALVNLPRLYATDDHELRGLIHESWFWLVFRDARTLSDGWHFDHTPGSEPFTRLSRRPPNHISRLERAQWSRPPDSLATKAAPLPQRPPLPSPITSARNRNIFRLKRRSITSITVTHINLQSTFPCVTAAPPETVDLYITAFPGSATAHLDSTIDHRSRNPPRPPRKTAPHTPQTAFTRKDETAKAPAFVRELRVRRAGRRLLPLLCGVG
ncbi:hypothetical protein [Streptomyces buecherae]|uniref:Uncharacterized protein n=1 Tax=Streptomyces buecherae TaxID=2763006 RepID=A0A7H8NI56_9ACTN|nr:hypothetical protein [Streptomyces buecherae]QKW54062.1 hypothetical protein HUT08_35900 [Streptomyces buecherae]